MLVKFLHFGGNYGTFTHQHDKLLLNQTQSFYSEAHKILDTVSLVNI